MEKMFPSKSTPDGKTLRKQNDEKPKIDMGTVAKTIIASRKFISSLPFQSQKIYKLGERGSGTRPREPLQDFEKIRGQCLQKGILWEDPVFPATTTSLFYSASPNVPYIWKRPKELMQNPQFFVDGYSRFDVNQGSMGDCWLLSAIASITLYRNVFTRVVPEDQSFTHGYAGIFHFRFWQYGRWIDIVVDDLLPTSDGKLIYVHSTSHHEFWSPLMEKAYAKLHGSYEALEGGQATEALEDFTGGVTEFFFLHEAPKDLFEIMWKSYERSSLICAGINADPDNPGEHEMLNGLVQGHAYTVSSVKFVELKSEKLSGYVQLVRLRNPWGSGEWSGPWSDRSREWQMIPEKERNAIGLTFTVDGEFWITYKDFVNYFTHIEICHFGPWSYSELELSKGSTRKWESYFYEGEWVRGSSAGGSIRYILDDDITVETAVELKKH